LDRGALVLEPKLAIPVDAGCTRTENPESRPPVSGMPKLAQRITLVPMRVMSTSFATRVFEEVPLSPVLITQRDHVLSHTKRPCAHRRHTGHMAKVCKNADL
jgi:hypothetical protein